jgi:hypothetical protein
VPALSPDSVLARNERLSWRILDDEAVILFPDAGTLHRLNGTGTRVWELIDGARTLADVGSLITDEFEVTADEALADLCSLAGDLVEADLAQVVG